MSVGVTKPRIQSATSGEIDESLALRVEWEFAAADRSCREATTACLAITIRSDRRRGPNAVRATVTLVHGAGNGSAHSEILHSESPAAMSICVRGAWLHMTISCGDQPLLAVSVRDGVPIYVQSLLPSSLGLIGGSYDRPRVTVGPMIERCALDEAG